MRGRKDSGNGYLVMEPKPLQVRKTASSSMVKLGDVMNAVRSPEKATHGRPQSAARGRYTKAREMLSDLSERLLALAPRIVDDILEADGALFGLLCAL